MAEKLAFHQLGRNRPAIDRHKWLAGARSLFVDQPCDQFFAAARLSADVDRRLTARQLVDLFAQIAHGQRVAEQAPIYRRAGAAHRRHAQRGADQFAQARQINRLGEEVEGAGLQRVDRGFQTAIRGDHRHRQLWMTLLNVLHQVQPRAVGQAHVGQAQVERIALQQRLGFAEVASTEGVEFHPSQGDFQEFADIRLVVDDEDFCRGLVFNFVSVREQR